MMRILIILLLFVSDVHGQIINASSPYVPLYLLDQAGGATVAYSLRKLSSYATVAVRVRKDTTGQPEQDIGFLSSGILDTVSLKNFISGRDAYVTKWYNQASTGSTYDLVQSTQSAQPRIAIAGVLMRNNRIAGDANNSLMVDFNSSSQFFNIPTFNLIIPCTISAVVRPFGTSSTGFFNYQSNTTTDNPEIRLGINSNANPRIGVYWNGAYVVSSTTTYMNSTLQVMSASFSSGIAFDFRINAASIISGTRSGTWSTSVKSMQLGRYTGLGYSGAHLSEFIIWNNVSVNSAIIESNQNSHYAIY